jgi:amino acid adenylation domain-containing protein
MINRPTMPASLSEMIIRLKDTEDKGVTFITGSDKETFISYSQIFTAALKWLGFINNKGVKPGDELVLQTEDRSVFIQVFWACILGGIIPVPVAVTFQGENARKLYRIRASLNSPSLLISKEHFQKLPAISGETPFNSVVFIEDLPAAQRSGELQPVSKDTIAFLQFSSGSTGNPKGVVITHQNLLSNIFAALKAYQCDEHDSFLNWMPMTHDTGLIGYHLYPMGAGVNQYHIPTDLFIRNPVLWLQKVSEHKATIICSPNFGYKYYLDHFTEEKGKGLDLSSVKVILNGAEPISAALCRRFMQTMEKFHLRPNVMCPAFGMAESTLVVSFPHLYTSVKTVHVNRDDLTIGRRIRFLKNVVNPQESIEIVNLGNIIDGINVRIADENEKELEEGYMGVVWIRGESVTSRYYNNEPDTRAVIREGGWLNTGDTGFLRDGCLYLVGRVKDIIFINGANIYPHDIEQTLEQLDGIETGKVLACGIPDESTASETVAVFILYKSTLQQFLPIVTAVKRLAASSLGIEVKYVLPVRKITKTTSGKVKRFAFVEDYRKGVYEKDIKEIEAALSAQNITPTLPEPVSTGRSTADIRQWLLQWLQQQLHISSAELDAGRSFAEYGMISRHAVRLAADLEEFLGYEVLVATLYSFPTINKLVEYFAGQRKEKETESPALPATTDNRIAVIGIGCRLPGGINSPADFWQLLQEQRCAVTVIPPDRWNVNDYHSDDPDQPGTIYTRNGAFIDQPDQFDPLFFGISPREAAGIDPQQRLLLEVCWEALEHAGIPPSTLRGSNTGVFVGLGTDDYQQIIHRSFDPTYFSDAYSSLGIERSIAAGRIAYILDLHGPVLQLDTACSSSLLSIHQASQQLLLGECSLALAGGVNLILSPENTMRMCAMKALSPSGLCKTFDDDADGYVRGEGAGMVVLKRLQDAIADGDNILSVIIGSAANHDGLSNGLTAPNGAAQDLVLERALAKARVTADKIQYVETHGTGTRLGDPVEVQSLHNVYGRTRVQGQPLIIGAVKTNIGHLEAAAGVAGFIKTVLALQHRQIPSSLHFRVPNRYIPWKNIAVKVADQPMPFPDNGDKNRAAVSAFGLSGTNVHIILEEGIKQEVSAPPPIRPSYPVLLSAKTPEALKAAATLYAGAPYETGDIAAVAYSSALTREHFPYRMAVEAANIPALRQYLQHHINGETAIGLLTGHAPAAGTEKLVWLFTGGGAQYWNMGIELYRHNNVFRQVIDHCNDYLKQQWDISLIALIYEMEKEEANEQLREMTYFQPAIYAISCALADMWKSWGIAPDMVAGHSMGEYAAAYVAGVFSLDDGLKLITERARLMQSVKEPGSMATIFASAEKVIAMTASLGNDLSIAAINGPELTVVSGKQYAVSKALKLAEQEGINSRELLIAHASHSLLMQPVLEPFRKVAATIRFHAPVIKLISNITGREMGSEMANAAYWCDHIIRPVLFYQSIQTITSLGGSVFMELGPQPNLLSMVRLAADVEEDSLLANMRLGHSSWDTMLSCLMTLYVKGFPVDWARFYGLLQHHRRSTLPLYPFQRQRCWIPTTKKENILPQNIEVMKHQPSANTAGRTQILNDLANIFGHLLKMVPAEINTHSRLLELGADSLVLTNAVKKIEKKYKLEFTIKQLFEEHNTIERLTDYISQRVTVDVPVPVTTAPAVIPVVQATPVVVPPAADIVKSGPTIPSFSSQPSPSSYPSGHTTIVARQLDIMEQQLRLLGQTGYISHNDYPSPPEALPVAPAEKTIPVQNTLPPVPDKLPAKEPVKHTTIFPKIDTAAQSGYTPIQQHYLSTFIKKYTEKTKNSKRLTQEYRSVLADNRIAMGFRFSTKEIHYPLQIVSSYGSKIRDVDDNEYIDLAMGFGVNLLGHRPAPVTAAIEQQLHTGWQLGPQSVLTGEVAKKVIAFTGMERVSFHNSGTEAVMTAVRLARAVTGKHKIAIFAGSYHGHFDGTLSVMEDADHKSVPLTLGVLQNMVEDVLMFDYTHPQLVEQIKAHAHELAAVVVEPVQSRKPGYQPVQLLKELRAMTTAANVLLIFDEMITGFRVHPGGAQAHFGVRADIATYGKVVGGGMPIGVVAGMAKFMDTLDGGPWQYGDDSYPEVATTYYAGTFCKHPLSMAAALALLQELERQGPALQQRLNERTAKLANHISNFLIENQVPLHVNHFGSLFHFSSNTNMDLFFYGLLEKGVYIWEGRTCFLSTAHSDEDTDHIIRAIKDTVGELQQHGFLPKPPDTAPPAFKKSSAITNGIGASVDRAPLSFGQESLWFIDQLEGSIQYHLPIAFRLSGKLNTTALNYALQRIIDRHDALRTVISQEDDEMYQRVIPGHEWSMQVSDELYHCFDTAALQHYVNTFTRQHIDLTKDYLLRASLLPVEEDLHILVIVFHHIAFDDWSSHIFFRELTEFYEAYATNRSVSMPLLPLTYREYAVRQQQSLTAPWFSKQLAYWAGQLKDTTPLNLPVDYPRQAVRSIQGALSDFYIDSALTARLRQFSQQQGATLYMTMLAAFNVLLYRYSGQEDICVGSPVAGRSEEEYEDLIGYFVNTIVLRSQLQKDLPFTSLLQQIARTTLTAYGHTAVPFEKVVEVARQDRGLARNPLFNVMFVWQRTPDFSDWRLGEAHLSLEKTERTTALFDLNFLIEERKNDMYVEVEYAADLYAAETVTRMGLHYRQLLEAIVAAPDMHIDRLMMLSADEKAVMENGFNTTMVSYPADKTFVDLFALQVYNSPEATALIFEDEQLSYRELDERSTQLMHYLRQQGVQAGQLVPVCLERSVDMIVSILAILKAGAAYVPIDPQYPESRVRFMLEDTGAGVVITHRSYNAALSAVFNGVILSLDEHKHAISVAPASVLLSAPQPRQLAYLIYTSGSTGKPKGVMVEHAGMLNHLYAKVNDLQLNNSSVVAYTASYTFDISVWQMLAAFLCGGTTIVYGEQQIFSPAQLITDIDQRKVTILELVPSYLSSVLQDEIPVALESLQYLLVTGEAVSPHLLSQWFSRYPAIPVVNAYGPTEASDDICHHIMDTAPTGIIVPLGKPVQNLQLYVVDTAMQVNPVGVPGEICVSGIGVSRGYLNRPELTAEKFIANPFPSGGRLYRTGDLGRWLPDGTMEYLGRIDDQVKIRGFRIEPGEIERVLTACKGVREAVVVTPADVNGNKRLIAYVVPEDVFQKEVITAYLQQQLPEYMVPAVLIPLEQLPLTANGKIDRKSLIATAAENIPDRVYTAPVSQTEKILTTIWEELLGVLPVSIYDNFFELGGNSLLAMRLRSVLGRHQLEMALKTLFLHPTIASLAAQLDNSSHAALLPAVVAVSRNGMLPLSYSQERLWFIHQLEGSIAYHLSAAITIKGPLKVEALSNALKAIVDRHEILRTVIRESGGTPYQEIIPTGRWQMQVADDYLHQDMEACVQQLVTRPFDLSADHMIRAELLKIAAGEHLLVLTLHHLAADARSVDILLEELSTLYNAAAGGQQAQLPDLPVQYADYAAWQRQYLSATALSDDLTYWKEKLSGVSALELPADNITDAQHVTGAKLLFTLNRRLAEELKSYSLQQEVTLFTTLLTAFKALLFRHTGQTDICVGSPVSAREQQETYNLIGFFVNTLPFRSNLENNPSFTTLLQQVKSTTLEAFEHQRVPFEKIVDATVKDRNLSRSPLFQVMFVMQAGDIPEMQLNGLEVSIAEVDDHATKFDISFFANVTATDISINIVYRSGYFLEATIVRMFHHFEQLLQAALRNPDQDIGTLSMITEEEEHRLMGITNTTVTAPTFVDLFMAKAVASPLSQALVFEDVTLSYGELDARSSALAHHLTKRGVKKGALIPLLIERSPGMIISILGILKAGAAYVPVDPESPAERISFILSDTAASLLVTSNSCRKLLPALPSGLMVVVAGEESNNEKDIIAPLITLPVSQDLLYVIYTSGSTGAPKGVGITHRNLSDYLTGIRSAIPLDACSSFGLLPGIATDLGNTILYGALATGGCLHLFSQSMIYNSEALYAYFSAHAIDCIKLVPSHWKALSPDGRLLLPRRLMIFGGETLETAVVQRIQSSGANCMIVNHYGPTETTIGKLLHIVRAGGTYGTQIPVGKPFSDTYVYVLNDALKLCPPGVAGELYIGGAGVSPGYLNRESLTVSRFIDDPLRAGAGKLYRTGDRVKYLDDGNILFLGRIDNQVKIHGYRVEPGEVEQVLNNCEYVSQAVVTTGQDRSGSFRLTAYVIPQGTFDKAVILTYLTALLPAYMIPAILIPMDHFPLMTNGKVDRRALPAPQEQTAATDVYAPPVTATEKKMAAIWTALLEVERIGIHDNFFALGGHSLLAIRVISAIRTQLGAEVTIRDIFNHPTVASLAVQLSQRLATAAPALVRTERPAHIPLSYSQERLWFIDQLEGSVAYHSSAALRLHGGLHVAALATSLQQLLTRHEVLRTVIKMHDDQAYQHIQEADGWELQQSSFDGDETQLQFYISSLISDPFDLSSDYMLRCHLLKLATDEHLLVITLHHIASDGWSVGIIIRELIALYAASIAGTAAGLPLLPVQYADYALWQRKYISGEWLSAHVSYWQQQLSDVPVLLLPTDYTRPAVQSNRGTTLDFEIEESVLSGLKALSQEQGTTLFMTLLSAFKVLLYRYSSQEDISVGTPIAGRSYQETEGLVGFFVNTLVLRSDLSGNPSFLSLLQRVKQTTLSAYDHQEVPFEQVVSAVVKERALSHNPLFQVMFVLQNTPAAPELELGGLHIEQENLIPPTSQFDQIWSLEEAAGVLRVGVTYCTDLFAASTIRHMQDHFVQLLSSVLSAPDLPVGDLPLLTSAEQLLLQPGLHYTAQHYPADKTIVDLFEAQVLRTPPAIAVEYEGSYLTYETLSAEADKLAGHLQANGVLPETLVAICMDRSLDMIIGILGILKAGGAYVPIDPLSPPERIAWILEDSRTELCVSNSRVAAVLEGIAGIEIVLTDQTTYNGVAAKTTLHPDNLAYVIYTSGSSGRSKGVLVEHGSVVNLVSTHGSYFGLDATDRIALCSNYYFDASVEQLFGALLTGATLVMVPADVQSDPQLFEAFLSTAGITHLEATYSFLSRITPLPYAGLRRVVSGGEACHGLLASQWSGVAAFYNIYGPTEATVSATVYQYNETAERTTDILPIGRPLANVSLYILDSNGQPVPPGAYGELHIGGRGVSRGYLNQPALTAEKYIHSLYKEERLYRTGDLVRLQADGNLVYAGRIDMQVKIRGYRIEPGEIEQLLQQHDQVKSAVVVAQEDTRLVAYIVSDGDPDTGALRSYLKSQLPEYMVPAYFMVLPFLPVTGNGKIDLSALPEIDTSQSGVGYVAPRNSQEEALCDVWRILLNVARVGVHDNFFVLGGHSLLAMRVQAAIRTRLHTEVSVKAIFAHATVSELSSYISQENAEQPLPAVTAQERPALIPLSYNQERLWFIDQLEGSVAYHMPGVLRLRGKPDTGALVASLKQILIRHEVLRTVIKVHDGQAYQHIQPADDWELQQSTFHGDDAQLQSYISSLVSHPFDLSKDYMLRCHLLKTGADEYLLVITLHHVASDGWSIGIIVKELIDLYAAAIAGVKPALPPLPVQYADYALWQRAYISGAWLATHLSYWQQQLSDVPVLALPADYARPAVQSSHGTALDFEIAAPLVAGLQALSKEQGTTLFMTLLSVFKVLLYRYSGQEDICVGAPVAGRTRQETEGLAGFFVNTLVLRSDLSGNPSFLSLLQQVKQTTLSAYDHQEVPFEQVVSAVVKERELSHNPLFQVMFVLQNIPPLPQLELGNLYIEEEDLIPATSQFDQIWALEESAEALKVRITYCTGLFAPATIQRMQDHFVQLLSSVISSPDTSVAHLRLLSSAEKILLQPDLHHIAQNYPKDKTIVDLFEAQVLRTPSAIAVEYEDQHLTYAALSAKADELAGYLQANGVYSDTLVAICIDRSLEMIIGILGILKAGGAYVPIDPSYPQERIAWMLEDTGAAICISSSRVAAVLDGIQGIQMVLADQLQYTGVVKKVLLQPDHLAYIIYTSGSTGKPKGVMIEHRNVVRLFETDSPLFDFNENDVWTLFHSFCFDFSVWEMYGALFYGGCLIVVPRAIAQDTTAFGELLIAKGVTVLNQTPGAFYVLQDYLSARHPDVAVRYVIFGGEALEPRKLRSWMELYPQCSMINMYGITETTVHVTYQLLHIDQLDQKSIIGKPIPTLGIYILTPYMQLSPIGVTGEMYVAGAGLARGYLNREVLTAERFITNPLNDQEKLYKTGDLGRWLPDGTIEYMGRIDDQVKIRGYRIELGEITQAILSSGLVKQLLVQALKGTEGSTYLVAYVVPVGIFDREGILLHVKTLLPDYMLPASFIALEAFPLTANGKIDKRALPVPGNDTAFINTYVAPGDETEEKLADIWKELLGLEKAGIYHSFFEVGGDSIKIIRLISKIDKVFGQKFKAIDIYKSNTIAEQAVLIREGLSTVHDDTAVQNAREKINALREKVLLEIAHPEAIEDVFPMSDIQEGMIYASLLSPGSGIYHDQFVYPLAKGINIPLFEKAFSLLVSKHGVLRTAFNLNILDSGVQVVYKDIKVKIHHEDLSQLTETAVAAHLRQFLEKERADGFDFNHAPLWRATVFQLQRQDVYVLQCHHAILDGWSVASLDTELNNIYADLLRHQDAQVLPLLACSYKDYVAESLAAAGNKDNRLFWQREMEGYKRLEIFSQAPVTDTLLKNYDAAFLEELKQRTAKDKLSLQGIFMSAYLYAIGMLAYDNELTVGLVTNNRPAIEDGDKLLGCFLNTIPFRFDAHADVFTWKDYFHKVERKLQELKGRNQMTLKEIARIAGEQSSGGNPFFDTFFNFVDFHIYDDLKEGFTTGNDLESIAEDELYTSFVATNTYLDCNVSITGNALTIQYFLRRKLKTDIALSALHASFEAVISAYMTHYNDRIDRRHILGKDVQERLLSTFNDTATLFPYKENDTLVSLFEAQVERTPDAIALEAGPVILTYRELSFRSGQLAVYLRSKGVGKDILVPVCMERSPEMIISILGIMKAGGAYVPVDVTAPAERVQFMLEDNQASLMVCSRATKEKIPQTNGIVMVIPEEITGTDYLVAELPAPDHLSYVIYTSGSTGKPKGVMVEHKGMLNHLFAKIADLQIDAASRVAFNASYTFDISVWQMFVVLLCGGRTVLYDDELIFRPDEFMKTVDRDEITILEVVPSYLSSLLHLSSEVNLSHLRYLLVTGEVVSKQLLAQWFRHRHYHTVPVVNAYGPTEASDDICHYIMHSLPAGISIPLGKPLHNLRIYILNAAHQLCPPGVSGEICVSGIGVSRGYLNRPALTEEKFIADPFNPGERMYCTGDLGRWLPDGNIEYFGRIDEQVKIRGFRIELGEIESVMNSCDLVKQAVVLARKDAHGNKRLIGYVVPEGIFYGDGITAYIKTQLPEYMVPGLLLEMDSMPLTDNGKINRKALPDPDISGLSVQAYTAPRTATEKSLTDICAQLLKVEKVGVLDNLYERGLDSLLLMRLSVAVHKTFGLQIPIRTFFQFATPEHLANYIEISHSKPASHSGEKKIIEL